ncbi:MAG: DedA family protein [Phycisphaerales bacterium JB063]
MIEDWLNQYAPNAPYLVIFGVLLLAGFGLPMPEDIPLMLGGYLCGQTSGHPHLWVMIPGCMIAILGADVLIFLAGKRWGRTLHRHWLMKRLVGGRNLARARVLFARHGAKFVFFARFLPGVRTPAFFTAGTFKMTLRQFLLWDGSAALLSVPWVVLLAAYFSDELEHVRDGLSKGKAYGFVALGVGLAVLVGYHLLIARKLAKVKVDPDKEAKKTGRAKP